MHGLVDESPTNLLAAWNLGISTATISRVREHAVQTYLPSSQSCKWHSSPVCEGQACQSTRTPASRWPSTYPTLLLQVYPSSSDLHWLQIRALVALGCLCPRIVDTCNASGAGPHLLPGDGHEDLQSWQMKHACSNLVRKCINWVARGLQVRCTALSGWSCDLNSRSQKDSTKLADSRMDERATT